MVSRKELPPLIITAAITGGSHGKEISPHHPETFEEQLEQTVECYKLGASMVHIHVRDTENPTLSSSDPQRFREINGLIREKCPEIIINNTSSSRGIETLTGKAMSYEEIFRSLEANPEVCSLTLGPLTGRMKLRERPPYRTETVTVGATTPENFDYIEGLARIALKRDIKPELEIWHHGMIPVLRYFIDQGLFKPPYWVQFVMGHPSGSDATPWNLLHEMTLVPRESVISVAAMMAFQTPMLTTAIVLGLNVRTGMEDNPYYNKGELATSNAQLVERVVRIAREVGRDIATPLQARQMMGLSEKPRQY
jgi:3-keto-5-aminohexanoate cleavage enzyme